MFMGPWVAILIIVGIAIATAGWAGNQSKTSQSSARQILDERLARGELTAAEHVERRGMLGPGPGGGRNWRPWAIVGAGLALIVLVASLGFGSGFRSDWGWTGQSWMGSHMGWGTTTTSNVDTFVDAREVAIEAGDLWFKPDDIELESGEEVNLAVTNTGGVFHDLTVPAADFRLDVEPGDEAVGGLTLQEPGTYEYFCSVPGHANGGMRGIITVTG